MTFPGKRKGLTRKVDTAAQEAERLGLTATLILRMAQLEIERAEPNEVESMARNNRRGKTYWPLQTATNDPTVPDLDRYGRQLFFQSAAGRKPR